MSSERRIVWSAAAALVSIGIGGAPSAQLNDVTQIVPAAPGGAIGKSLEQQIGPGRGDVDTPQSSIYLIKRDPARAIRRGRSAGGDSSSSASSAQRRDRDLA